MLVDICLVAVRWRLEMKFKQGMLAIFRNGEQAVIHKADISNEEVAILFDREVTGSSEKSAFWNYKLDGKWIGDGNDIVKTLEV